MDNYAKLSEVQRDIIAEQIADKLILLSENHYKKMRVKINFNQSLLIKVSQNN